jgi:ATP phosphoribosyltransferase
MSKRGLTTRQYKAIEMLLEHSKIEDAAKACKSTRQTIYNYLADPQFKQALREAQDRALNAVIARLSGMGAEAIATLANEMKDAEAKSSDRATAARITLDFLFADMKLL